MATFQEIHAAADSLAENGEKATMSAVRKALGGGSYSTISEAMQSWPGRVKTPVESSSDVMPDIVKAAASSLWVEAKKQAQKELESARHELQVFKAELEAQTKEAFDLLESTTSQLDVCVAEKKDLEARVQALSSDLAVRSSDVLVAKATLEEVRRSVEQLQQSLEVARLEAQAERALARTAGELAAELRGKLDAVQSAGFARGLGGVGAV
jgi:DNA repair exonuclease SbcCD ATPase subunit